MNPEVKYLTLWIGTEPNHEAVDLLERCTCVDLGEEKGCEECFERDGAKMRPSDNGYRILELIRIGEEQGYL